MKMWLVLQELSGVDSRWQGYYEWLEYWATFSIPVQYCISCNFCCCFLETSSVWILVTYCPVKGHNGSSEFPGKFGVTASETCSQTCPHGMMIILGSWIVIIPSSDCIAIKWYLSQVVIALDKNEYWKWCVDVYFHPN